MTADADLITLCQAHPALLAAANTETQEDGPAYDAYRRSWEAIGARPPQTLAGLIALARVAQIEATMPDGSQRPESTPAANWAWTVTTQLRGIMERGI